MRSAAVRCHAAHRGEAQPQAAIGRRAGLLGALAVAALAQQAPQAGALILPPPGFRLHTDRLDGYAFTYPEDWIPVTSSGNDVFYRNPRNVEENLFVDVSSPSSSNFATVTQLGTPEQAAQRCLDQYLNKEFMSTRLGIKRVGKILSATSRQGADGKTYYDLSIQITSYASRDAYVATQAEVRGGSSGARHTTFLASNLQCLSLKLPPSAQSQL